MCTLTYVPLQNGVCITSNRDEHILRKGATLPQSIKLPAGYQVICPIDQEAYGTWIALRVDGTVGVILNGAFDRHEHQPPYRKSRGLVLLDAFGYPDFDQFAMDYGLLGIEPFTLVCFERMPGGQVHELRWDGKRKHMATYDPKKSHVWSAAMMYPPEIQRETEKRFRANLPIGDPDPLELLRFNREERYEQKVQRNGIEPIPELKTLSISQVLIEKKKASFRYFDQMNDLQANAEMALV